MAATPQHAPFIGRPVGHHGRTAAFWLVDQTAKQRGLGGNGRAAFLPKTFRSAFGRTDAAETIRTAIGGGERNGSFSTDKVDGWAFEGALPLSRIGHPLHRSAGKIHAWNASLQIRLPLTTTAVNSARSVA